MNDNYEQSVVETTLTISVGEVLRSAREARQLDIEDICNYLRLSRRQVVALESDDFASLPEATITRGFIRNYARMLEVDAEPLLEAYRSLSATEEQRPISIQSENIQISGNDKSPWLLYVIASIVILLLVAAWIVYMDYIPKKTTEAAYSPSETELEIDAAIDQVMPLAESASLSVSQTEAGSPEVVSGDEAGQTGEAEGDSALAQETSLGSAVAATSTVSENAPPASTMGLAIVRLQATERSWVSITDRNNRNLFDKIMAVGVEEVVRGEPPLQVVVGNAPSTTLIYNDRVIDLAPATNDRVARLKLE